MTVRSFVVSPFAENTYVLSDGADAALVDPGTMTDAERQAVEAYIEGAGLTVRHLLLTHGHLDHVFGAAHFQRRYGATAAHGGWQLHAADDPVLAAASTVAAGYGVPMEPPPPAAHALAHGDTVALGQTRLEVRHAPGHSPGSVVFYSAADGVVIGGDVLFAGSVGRTDLPGGDAETLLASIRRELYTLPDATTVYPGHGPATTVGEEKATNPFVRGERPGAPTPGRDVS